MRALSLALLVTLVAAGAERVAACQFDSDCSPGSQCVKQAGQTYGICSGGLLPGNVGDRKPVYDPLKPGETTGDTCLTSDACGPGYECRKGQGDYGVCVPKGSQ